MEGVQTFIFFLKSGFYFNYYFLIAYLIFFQVLGM